MKRILTSIFAVVPVLSLVACGNAVGGGGLGISKDEARALGGLDQNGDDICASEGWYADGTCDDFCPVADKSDCSVTNQCPDDADPAVHYVGTHLECIAALWACDGNQIAFDSPECGCGCIDVVNPGPSCGGFAGVACDEGFFCNYGLDTQCGAADQTGTCEPIPGACPEYYGPVCGCDGQTYSNPCFAHAAGVSVAQDGACGGGGEICGGFAGLTCGAGEFCNFTLGAMCGSGDQSGTCAVIPEGCTEEYAPVCGCDGQTYGNACSAHSAGVSVASIGECGGGSGAFCGGIAGIPCGAGEFCDFTLEAMCGAGDQGGTCATIPEACDASYDPVCGCDGKTYGNACSAHAEGVAVYAAGACK